jgi:hypothetical protein
MGENKMDFHKMDFPSAADFLDTFGIEPIDVDPTIAFCRYVKQSSDGHKELDISFSAVANSFQVVLRCGGKEISTISSEGVNRIELFHDRTGSGINVIFEMQGTRSEARVRLEPDLYCHWWALKN